MSPRQWSSPQMLNPNFNMRKHQICPNRGASHKTPISSLQMCEGHQDEGRREPSDRHRGRPRGALESKSRSWERGDWACGGECRRCASGPPRLGRRAGEGPQDPCTIHPSSSVRENKPAGYHPAPVRSAERARAQVPSCWPLAGPHPLGDCALSCSTRLSQPHLGLCAHRWVIVGGHGQSWRSSHLCCTGGT